MAVISLLLVFAIIAHFQEGDFENRRTTDVCWLVIIMLVPTIVWFAFVPSRLEFSDTGFTVKFPFRPLHAIDWSDFHSYGPGENTLVIQFTDSRTFQIFPQAYHPSDWRVLENFLSSKFPDKRVSQHRGY